MAIYRKQPTQFDIKRGSDKRLISLVPFRGLEINENPQLNSTGSCADMVNMTVDNDAFLTLRPRLVEDEAYWTARNLVTQAITFPHSGVTYTHLGLAQRLKDGYFFVVYYNISTVPLIQNHTFVYVDDKDGLFWVDYADFFQIVLGETYPNVFSSGWGFDNFIIFPEKDYYKFIVRDWTTSFPYKNVYKFYKDGATYKFIEAVEYVPTYKNAIINQSTLESSPIYEDLNVLSDKYKVSFIYDDESNLDITKLSVGSTSVTGTAYVTKEFTGLTGQTIVQHDDNGYIYYLNTNLTACFALTGSSTQNLIFYRYDFLTKTSETVFIVKVYGDTGTGGITVANLTKLYKLDPAPLGDYNGKPLNPFIYDISTNTLVRPELFTGDRLDIHVFKIAESTFTTVTILKHSMVDNIVHLFYSDGLITVAAEWSTSYLGLITYRYGDTSPVYLIGQKRPDDMFVPAIRPVDHYKEGIDNVITYAFVNGGRYFIISAFGLKVFTEQILEDPSDLVLTVPSGTVVDDVKEKRSFMYYDVGATLDHSNRVDLTTLCGYVPHKSSFIVKKLSVVGSMAIFYNHTAVTSKTNTMALRIPLRVLADSDVLDISVALSSNPSFVPYQLSISGWGMPIIIGWQSVSGTNYWSFAKIDADASRQAGFLKYTYFITNGVANTAYDFTIYSTTSLFNVRRSADTIIQVKVNNEPIEITYSIANNDTNPLKIDSELLDKYNEYRSALNFTSEAHGTALMGNSRLLYNDKYVFISEPNNYDYYPTILANKTVQPVRFASSYMQTVGTIYERNNIEYVSFVDNPFITTQYLAHTQTVIFQSVEQRAIDYLPNGHIVSYAGVTMYLNEGGVYALNFNPDTPQDSERKASLISKAINAKLLKEDLTACKIVNSDPYVLFMFPKTEDTRVYAYDLMKQMWFYWELPFVVTKTSDDNRALKLYDGYQYVYFSDEAIPVDVKKDDQVLVGNVERYLDFDELPIRWMWKSQPMALGSITSRKQITETYFVFVNQNASIITDENTLEIVQNKITVQRFGIRFYTYKELVTESPVVEYEGQLNIINNLRRRTYLNRFKYCQLLCYNIDSDDAPLDKVRLANIVITYKYLTGGK